MRVHLHFKEHSITPNLPNHHGSNSHTIDAWRMGFHTCKLGVPAVVISLTPESLATEETQRVTAGREIFNYSGHRCKFIEIPCDELYSAETWD